MLGTSDRNQFIWGSSAMVWRALRVAACGLAIGIVLTSGVARAGDDDDDEDESFERKIIDNVMKGVQGRQFDNSGIDYRERSPLVIPPKIDLPPPSASQTANVANWPKDPEVKRRRIEADIKRKERLAARDTIGDPQVLKPNQVNGDAPRLPTSQQSGYDTSSAGDPQVFKPSEYGYKGGIFGGMLKKDDDVVVFTAEPPRTNLSKPPAGYQTPSPSYAYGTTGQAPATAVELDAKEGAPLKPGRY